MFKKFLAAVGIAPKSLDAAKAAQDTAKEFGDGVAALFTQAGLDLDVMLSAGPDSLKAHIAGLSSSDAELSAALLEIVELKKSVATAVEQEANAKAAFASANTAIAGVTETLAANGVKVDATKPLAETLPSALEARIAIKARELVAATGGPVLDDKPSADAAADKTESKEEKPFGLAKVQAEFEKQFKAK